MSERGSYGQSRLAWGPPHRSSWGAWLIGGLAVGGAVLWAKHQADQVEKLYVTAGLPYQGFAGSLRTRAGELSAVAGEKFQGLAHRLGTRKEI
jgi:hypothetical protein